MDPRNPIRITEPDQGQTKRPENALDASSSVKKGILGGLTNRKFIDALRVNKLSRRVRFVAKSAINFARQYEIVQFSAVAFLCFVFALLLHVGAGIVSLRQEVSADIQSVYSNLLSSIDSEDDFSMSSLLEIMANAHRTFAHIKTSLGMLGTMQQTLIEVEGTAASVNHLLDSSLLLTQAGEEFVGVGVDLELLFHDAQTLDRAELKLKYPSLTTFLDEQFSTLLSVQSKLSDVQLRLSKVDSVLLPMELKSDLAKLEDYLFQAISFIDVLHEYREPVLSFLGHDYPKRYVVLLQNAGEMRATGGFLGSVLFVTFNDGWIDEYTFTDIYDLAGQVRTPVMAPPGLEELTLAFGLQDANYYPDFAESARNVLWFLDQAGEESVDGVFAVNTRVATDIMQVVGPIEFGNPPRTVDADTFLSFFSLLIESKENPTSPKDVLGDFLGALLDTVDLKEDGPYLALTFLQHLDQRSISFYSSDTTLQEFFEEHGIAGRLPIREPEEDFLMIVPTSLSANKSDHVVHQFVDHKTEILNDGHVLNRVTLRRTHTWDEENTQSMENLAESLGVELNEKLRFILGNGENRHYLRMYVPLGSSLLQDEYTEEVDVYHDGNYTVFAFPMNVKVGETAEITLTYQLPFRMDTRDRYSFHVMKSLGEWDYFFTKSFLNFNRNFSETFSKDTSRQGEGEHVYFETLESDAYYFGLIDLR